MAHDFDIAFLGASSVSKTTGAPLWEPYIPIGNDTDDVEPFGPVDAYQSLGVSSAPWPKDENGHAEAVILRHCGGKNAVCIGARDTRTANVIGNLKPGDTVVHSTGPQQAAQLQLKEAKRHAVLVSKDSGGQTMMALLDGTNDKIQITAFGGNIEMSKSDGSLSLIAPDGTGIIIGNGEIHFMGTPVMGVGNPAGMAFMLGPPAGQPPGPVAVLLVPAQGVAAGVAG